MAKGKNPEQDCPPVSASEAIVGQIEGLVVPVAEANAKADRAAEKADRARAAADQAGAEAIAGFNQLSADINIGMQRAAEILHGAVRSGNTNDGSGDEGQTGSTDPEDAVEGNTDPQIVVNNSNTQVNNNPEDSDANSRANRLKKRAYAVGALVAAVAVLGAGYLLSKGGSDKDKVSAANTEQTDNKMTASGESCDDSWARQTDNNAKNRVDGNGQESLGDADTTEEARAAANEWLEDRKDESPVVLAGMSKSMFDVTIDPNKYYDSKGCATPYAVQKVAEVQGAIAVMKVSTKDPSANSINSGVSGGRFNQSGSRGITGDRSGITLVNPKTGEKIGLMARCANPTFEGNPGLPKGPTDEPKKKTPKTPGVTPKTDRNDTPAGVPGHNKGTPDSAETTQPKPGSRPDGVSQPQKPKPPKLPEPVDTRPPQQPAKENPIPQVTEPPINDNGSADQDKTTDPGGF